MSRASSRLKCCAEGKNHEAKTEESHMDTDLTPLGEREDEELEVIPEQVESVSPQDGEPLTILADEPTGKLDTLNGKRIIELLKTLAEQGKTVIVVTHDRTIAKEADVRLEMEDGRIRGAGNSTAAPTRALAPVRKKKGRMRR